MENREGNLKCTANIEWLNPQGCVYRKVSFKSGQLRIIRNEHKVMFIEVSGDKSAPIKLQIKAISVHNKFMNEGKASIKFNEISCSLILSNAPPSQLLTFMKTLFVKVAADKGGGALPLRAQLLSSKPKSFEEISPVTSNDLEKAQKKISKASDTTPSPSSRKRKIAQGRSSDEAKAPAAKKLYTPSPVPNEPLTIEQQDVMDACLSNQNVFFTGSAGTGKSYLLKRIIAALPPDVTIATASTGIYHIFNYNLLVHCNVLSSGSYFPLQIFF